MLDVDLVDPVDVQPIGRVVGTSGGAGIPGSSLAGSSRSPAVATGHTGRTGRCTAAAASCGPRGCGCTRTDRSAGSGPPEIRRNLN